MLHYEPLTCQDQSHMWLSQFGLAVYNHGLIIKIVYTTKMIISHPFNTRL